MKDVIRISMKSLFTEEEKINLQKQLEMDREEYYTKKGIEQGIEQGLSQGISQGITQGKKENSIEIAQKMLNKNIPIEDIIELTNLSKKELEKLIK